MGSSEIQAQGDREGQLLAFLKVVVIDSYAESGWNMVHEAHHQEPDKLPGFGLTSFSPDDVDPLVRERVLGLQQVPASGILYIVDPQNEMISEQLGGKRDVHDP